MQNDEIINTKINSDKNKECIDYLINWCKESFNLENVVCTYNDEKNTFDFKVDNYSIGSVRSDVTVYEATASLGWQYDRKKQDIAKKLNQTNENAYQSYVGGNNNKRVNLNENVIFDYESEKIEEVIKKLDDLEREAPESSDIDSIINNKLSGKLKEEYNKDNLISTSELKNLKTILNEYKLKVKYSYEMLVNSKEKTNGLLASIVEEIFNFGGNAEYKQKSYEEKAKYLEEMLINTKDMVYELEKAIKDKGYDLGIPLNENTYNVIFPFAEALGIDMHGNSNPIKNGQAFVNPDGMHKLISCINDDNLLENIGKYLNGEKFEDTLLDSFIKCSKDPIKENEDANYLTNLKTNAEKIFITRYVDPAKYISERKSNYVKSEEVNNFLNEQNDDFWDLYSRSLGPNGFNVKYIDDVTDDYVNSVKELMRINFTDESGNFYDFQEEINSVYQDYSTKQSDLLVLKEYQKELQKQINLLPYESDKDDPDFWKYFAINFTTENHDYVKKYAGDGYDNVLGYIKSKVESDYAGLIDYCTQEECALIMYYLKESGDTSAQSSKANRYLYNIWDTLNMRKGFNDAYEVVSSTDLVTNLYNYTIGSGVDGVSKWLYDADNTLRIIGNVVIDSNIKPKPTSSDTYKMMFITNMLESAKLPQGMRGIYETEYPGLLDNVSMAGAELAQFSYTMFNQAGNMLIPMVVGSLTGGLVGSGIVGSSLVGVGAAGSAAGSSISRGEKNNLTVLEYAALNGLSEAALTQMLSGLPGVGKVFEEGRSFLSSCTGEAKEEFLQAFIENGLNTAFFGDEFNFDETLDEAKLGAFYGFMLSFAINGSVGRINITKNGQTVSLDSNQFATAVKNGTSLESVVDSAMKAGTPSSDITEEYMEYIKKYDKSGLSDRISKVWLESDKDGKGIIYVETKDGGTYRTTSDSFKKAQAKANNSFASPTTLYDTGIDEFVDELIADGIKPGSLEWEQRVGESAMSKEIVLKAYQEVTGSTTENALSQAMQAQEDAASRFQKAKENAGLYGVVPWAKEYNNIIELIRNSKNGSGVTEIYADDKGNILFVGDYGNVYSYSSGEDSNHALIAEAKSSLEQLIQAKHRYSSLSASLSENDAGTKGTADIPKGMHVATEEDLVTSKTTGESGATEGAEKGASTVLSELEREVENAKQEAKNAQVKAQELVDEAAESMQEGTDTTEETQRKIKDAQEASEEAARLKKMQEKAEQKLRDAVEDMEAEGLTPSDQEGQQMMSERAVSDSAIEEAFSEAHTSDTDTSHDGDSAVRTDPDTAPDSATTTDDDTTSKKGKGLGYVIATIIGALGLIATTITLTGSGLKLTINGDLNMTIAQYSTYVEYGYSASDPTDGDLTNSVVVTGSVDTSKVGEYKINYSVTNSKGDTVSKDRTVNVVQRNTGDLVITLKGDNPMTIYQGNTFNDPGVTATDKTDGDITKNVVVTNNVDTSKVGEYKVTYSITNSKGETITQERVVKVVKRSGSGSSSSNNDGYIIKTTTSMPKKYKLTTNGRDTLTNIINDYVSKNNVSNVDAVGMNIIVDGNNYNDLLACDNVMLGREASLVSIYNGMTLSSYHNSSCFNNRGVFYFKNYGSMIITSVTTQNEYDTVINNHPNDTFIYQDILVQSNSKMTISTTTTDNIAFCATGNDYKVFIPKNDVTLNDYADTLIENNCNSGVLLPGNGYIEYHGKIDSIITKGSQEFDSLMYFN